jgi:hypothetical protein
MLPRERGVPFRGLCPSWRWCKVAPWIFVFDGILLTAFSSRCLMQERRKTSWVNMKTNGDYAVSAIGENVSSIRPLFRPPKELTFVSQKPASTV